MKTMARAVMMMCCAMFLAAPAFAAGSGAFRLEVPDAEALGTGGAFVGKADSPAAVYYNPAGMTQLKTDSISVGVCSISPRGDAESSSGVDAKMERQNFLVPAAFYVTDLGIKNVAFGVGATSSWGLGTNWPEDSFMRYNATHSEVVNEDYLLTAAYQITDKLSFGVGVDIDHSRVDKEKKLQQASGADGNFRLKGDSTTGGIRLAMMYKLNEQHQFGLMYRGAMEHKYKGKVYLRDLDNSPTLLGGLTSYQAVFGSTYQTEVVAKSTLPQSAILGYTYKPNEKWVFSADVEWMNWSSTEEEELAYPDETDAMRLAVLNNGNPDSRDWSDAISTAVGAQYSVTDRLRLRGGYFFHQTPIPEVNFQSNLPDSNSHSLTAGFGYDLTKSLKLDVAYASMFFSKRKIENTVASGTISGTYTQRTDLLAATLTYSF